MDGKRDSRASAQNIATGQTTETNSLESIECTLLEPAAAKDTLRAVCAHITKNEGAESSRALAGLIRALYLDGSTFTFESLDCLGPVMRRHAEHMISARLWNTWPEEEWQKAFSALSSYEFKEGKSMLVGSPLPVRPTSTASGLEASRSVMNAEHSDARAQVSTAVPVAVRSAGGAEAAERMGGGASREWIARLVVLVLFILMAAALTLHLT